MRKSCRRSFNIYKWVEMNVHIVEAAIIRVLGYSESVQLQLTLISPEKRNNVKNGQRSSFEGREKIYIWFLPLSLVFPQKPEAYFTSAG